MLTIRVNYNDVVFHNSAASWSKKLFGYGMHQLNHYYQSISYGRFTFAPAEETQGEADGIITVSLPKIHPDSGSDSAIHPDLKAALIQADPYINYSRYDQNEDGVITPKELILMFIVAGNEDAFSGPNELPGVWAHQWCVMGDSVAQLDGVQLMNCLNGGNYAIFGERHEDDTINYSADATVGVIAHELGHAAFNLPDLYDTTPQAAADSAGIGYFGLMGAGMWGLESLNDLYGNTPVSMMAWSKLQNGWIAPEIMTDTLHEQVVLHDTDSLEYNIALLPINEQECFLLENRAATGYDRGLFVIQGFYRGGVAIWHIDQTMIDAGMLFNTVNADAGRKGIDLEEAARPGLDESYKFPGDARNLFYVGNQTGFSDDTSPSARSNDGSITGISVTVTSEPGSTMHADVINPNKVPAP